MKCYWKSWKWREKKTKKNSSNDCMHYWLNLWYWKECQEQPRIQKSRKQKIQSVKSMQEPMFPDTKAIHSQSTLLLIIFTHIYHSRYIFICWDGETPLNWLFCGAMLLEYLMEILWMVYVCWLGTCFIIYKYHKIMKMFEWGKKVDKNAFIAGYENTSNIFYGTLLQNKVTKDMSNN